MQNWMLSCSYLLIERANGLRYPLVGGTRQRYFAGTNSKPRKLPENAQTPTSRVHAVLGVFCGFDLAIRTKNIFSIVPLCFYEIAVRNFNNISTIPHR
jgi:hypothetical protein